MSEDFNFEETEVKGKIKNVKRKSQQIDGSRLRWGNITMTDLDMLFEFNDKVFIFVELKYKDTPIPFGQQLAMRRIVNTLAMAGKIAAFLIVRHQVDEGDIDPTDIPVSSIWHNEQELPTTMTLKQTIEHFRQLGGIK